MDELHSRTFIFIHNNIYALNETLINFFDTLFEISLNDAITIKKTMINFQPFLVILHYC
jgi:hypothetical protein